MKVDPFLLEKYNVAVPRYTSYPTVPFWKEGVDVNLWKQSFKEEFAKNNLQNGVSLYLHLPFCDSLCTYCGCNKKITTNHNVEQEYIDAIIKEWKLYRQLMNEPPIIREIHIGGGTPTFFSPRNLKTLVDEILKRSIVHPRHDFSIEGHPNNTTTNHLKVLHSSGFRRISFGVQDNDPGVQNAINRIQPFENVRRITEEARNIGFRSINYDLIYGLPFQSMETMKKTIFECLSVAPDRIAYYSYAHLPADNKVQRLFDENDLPSPSLKIQLYLLGKKLLMSNGYRDIGMDHFALPDDDLYKASIQGNLHRNFMGYTTRQTGMMLGLGVSAISDSGIAYAQNEKTLHNYYQRISGNELAIAKGCYLNEEDIAFKSYIRNISCSGHTLLRPEDLPVLREFTFPELEELEKDGLVKWDENEVTITPAGKNFIRNICKAFDLFLLRKKTENKNPLFSKAI